MRVASIRVTNFRNFRDCTVVLGKSTVLVGENRVGKSNLLRALRIVLDPGFSEAERTLGIDDFWDGVPRPIPPTSHIEISVRFVDFTANPASLALLARCLVTGDPSSAEVAIRWSVRDGLENAARDADLESIAYGGGRMDNEISLHHLRRWFPAIFVSALRNTEDDLMNWRRSPLRPLIVRLESSIEQKTLESIADSIHSSASELAHIPQVSALGNRISQQVRKIGGPSQAIDTSLNVVPNESHRLLRTLRIFTDHGRRTVADASLGTANLFYLALLLLDVELRIAEGDLLGTLLIVEEPEAHLHPHVQRHAFRSIFRPEPLTGHTVIVTTHSPNIACVAPLDSIAQLQTTEHPRESVARRAANPKLSTAETRDLERYIDVTRAELFFARGVLLVEGVAEEYLVPTFARLLDIDLDDLGISVCSVEGTNFLPFVRLLGPMGLGVPMAVVTDRDPVPGKASLGTTRAKALVTALGGNPVWPNNDDEAAALAEEYGIFLNKTTLEHEIVSDPDVLAEVCETLAELAPSQVAKERANAWATLGAVPQAERRAFMADVETIGKGRFAQRLAAKIYCGKCPPYIARAIERVRDMVS